MMGAQVQDMNPVEAISKALEVSPSRKFKESFELILKLNVDPTQGDQNIRGTCMLPAGTGQNVRVCVFADKEFHDQLRELGADIIGDESVLKQIAAGEINFDKIVTTPEHMSDLKQMARILGPKGMMPNVKSGNLVKPDDLMETVKSSKMGLIEYRVNENSFIMGKFGKRDFKPEDLEKNLVAFLESVKSKRIE